MLRLRLAGLAVVIGTATGGFAQNSAPKTSPGAVLPASPVSHGSPAVQAPLPSQKTMNASDLSPVAKRAEQRLSPWAAQVRKLALARINEDVILSYIDAAGTFNLTSDQIIGLTEAGVPSNVIAAMIQHDADILAGVREVLASITPSGSEPPLIPPPSRPLTSSPPPQPSTATRAYAARPEYPPDVILEPLDDLYYQPPEMRELSPVRKPYPVQLTAPILVWPTDGRIPNTVLIQSFR